MGLSLAARFAGYRPKISPTATANEKASTIEQA